jgi:hypothetical protein
VRAGSGFFTLARELLANAEPGFINSARAPRFVRDMREGMRDWVTRLYLSIGSNSLSLPLAELQPATA